MKQDEHQYRRHRMRGRLLWSCIFAAVFFLYLDFWLWHGVGYLLAGWLPLWMVWHMLVIVVFSLAALALVRRIDRR